MRNTKALWVGAIALVVVLVLIIVQLTMIAPQFDKGPIGGELTVSGCNPKASQIRLLARPMRGEASTAPNGTRQPSVETTTSTTSTSTTTTSTTTTLAPPIDDAPTVEPPAVAEPTIPPTTAVTTTTTSSPSPSTTTTTTQPPLVLTTTTAVGHSSPRASSERSHEAAPQLELASHTSRHDMETAASGGVPRELKASVRKTSPGAFEFAFENAQSGIAYQLGGTIENDSCDGASWAGPANGIVIADEEGKLQVPIAVTVATTLRVYAGNSKYAYLNGRLRQHWQKFDSVDVTKDATRVFRWEMPADTADAAENVEWQVSLLPFGKDCETPAGLVATGMAEHVNGDNPNAPQNVFTVDFTKLHQSLFGTTDVATSETPKPVGLTADGAATTVDLAGELLTGKPLLSDGSLSYYGLAEDKMRISLVSMFNGTYHVRAIPKNGASCGNPSSSVTIREIDGKSDVSLTEVEVNRFNKEIGKNAEGKPAPIWSVSDEVDWSSAQYGKRVFHWATTEPKTTVGEWQLYGTGDVPTHACGDPPSLIDVGKALYEPGALDANKLDTSFVVDFYAVSKKLDRSQSYQLRVVPKTNDGSCAGPPSNAIQISFASRATIDVNKGYGQLEVYRGGGAPYVLEGADFGATNWTTGDSVDWNTPSNAKRSFHWALGNADDVVSGRWQLLAPDAKHAPITCDDPSGVLASGPAPYSPGLLSAKKMKADFEVDLAPHVASLDATKPVYVRVVATRESGACDIATQLIALTWKQKPAFEVTEPLKPADSAPTAPIRAEVTGYVPLSAPSAAPPYCYTVVNPFKAADAVQQMRAFQEDPAFLPVDTSGVVAPGTRLCFTPVAPQKETESFFGTMVDIFDSASHGYQHTKNGVVGVVAATVESLGIVDCSPSSECQKALKVALEAGLAGMGIPPTPPNAGPLIDGGVDYLAAQIAEQADVSSSLIERAGEIAKEELRQLLIAKQHPYSDVPEPCPANACVADSGARAPAVELSVTRDAAAPADIPNASYACVSTADAELYATTCAKLPTRLRPGQTMTVPLALRVDLDDEVQEIKSSDSSQFKPADGVSFEEWWKSQALELWKKQTMDTTPSFTLAPTGGTPRTFTTNQSWGTLAVENWG